MVRLDGWWSGRRAASGGLARAYPPPPERRCAAGGSMPAAAPAPAAPACRAVQARPARRAGPYPPCASANGQAPAARPAADGAQRSGAGWRVAAAAAAKWTQAGTMVSAISRAGSARCRWRRRGGRQERAPVGVTRVRPPWAAAHKRGPGLKAGADLPEGFGRGAHPATAFRARSRTGSLTTISCHRAPGRCGPTSPTAWIRSPSPRLEAQRRASSSRRSPPSPM